MPDARYLAFTKEALVQIRAAIESAADLLPTAVKQQHWIRQKISPEPWASTADWYKAHFDLEYGQQTSELLSHLVSLASAREALHGLLMQAEVAGRTPDLSLPKVRRTP